LQLVLKPANGVLTTKRREKPEPLSDWVVQAGLPDSVIDVTVDDLLLRPTCEKPLPLRGFPRRRAAKHDVDCRGDHVVVRQGAEHDGRTRHHAGEHR
jgi:hypothetical protein